MSIRMNRREAAGETVVELHGWLSEGVLAELESLCASVTCPLRLDLANLAGADETGLIALRRLAAAGARLQGASPYIRLLLEPDPAPSE